MKQSLTAEQLRAEFEAWFSAHWPTCHSFARFNEGFTKGQYVGTIVQATFEAYCAGRSSSQLESPQLVSLKEAWAKYQSPHVEAEDYSNLIAAVEAFLDVKP